MFARLLTLHARLCSERSVNCTQLAKELEVSRRSIQRDVEFLRDCLGAPVKWEPSTRTYFYSGTCDLLPLLRLDADEALALAVAAETFASWQGQPLGEALRRALEKIGRIMGGGIELTAGPLREAIAQPPADAKRAESERKHFATLMHARRRNRVVRITYLKPTAGEDAEPPRDVHPLCLACLDHRWVMLAHDCKSGEVRPFILSRIQTAVETPERFTPPPKFDADTYLRGSMSAFVGTAEIDVSIAFEPAIAGYLREVPWHSSQAITTDGQGRIVGTYRVNNLIPMHRKVLACGGQATALAPTELRQSIATGAQRLLACHAPQPPPPTPPASG